MRCNMWNCEIRYEEEQIGGPEGRVAWLRAGVWLQEEDGRRGGEGGREEGSHRAGRIPPIALGDVRY